MVSSFVNPVINPESKLGVSSFDDTDPVRLWQNPSEENLNTVIRAIYKQVLGNAHVMESERLVVPESQLKQGDITVREFVRQIAYADLYRCRFFDSCPRNRAIELNFKHLLGRAPESYEEITAHTHLLDKSGYEAEIDSYIDSDEYFNNFGDDTVPYYQGYKTQTGKKMVGFTHMFQLLRGACSSDKDIATNNSSRLNRSIMENTPSEILPVKGVSFPWQPPIAYAMDANDIIAKVLGLKKDPLAKSESTNFQTGVDYSTGKLALARQQAQAALQQQIQEQSEVIATLQQQLAELRPFASIAASQFNQGGFSGIASVSTSTGNGETTDTYNALQQKFAQQEQAIADLRQQIADARPLATVGEYRLNKWRSRSF
ncbi:MAG: phycobilisome rod-core linker polypeptide [Calothrix sp. MO_167.B42]|nr:phycobilisome rod-core linker polypeptide [Calothrix sp. MO_167.B42]